MRLCDITEFYAHSSGGVRTYIAAKARYATEVRGWDHVLIVPAGRGATLVSGQSRTYEIKSPRIPWCAPYRLLCDFEQVRAVLAKERPDVVEVGSPYFAPWLTKWALDSLDRRTPLVGFYHSDFPATYAAPLARRLGKHVAVQAERLAWRYAASVYGRCSVTLAASTHVASTLTSHGIPRVRRVRLGVDLELFHPRRCDPAFRQRLGVAPSDTLLLFVGRLNPEKGIRTLLQAFCLLPPGRFRLLVIGDGPCAREVAEFARIHTAVRHHGYEGDRDKLAVAYASSDLLVAPGAFETFGLTIIEAQASGLAVVTVRGGAAPELVAPHPGATARPGDPADLAAAIVRTSALDRVALGSAARAYAEARFDWPAAFDDLTTVYEELLSQ